MNAISALYLAAGAHFLIAGWLFTNGNWELAVASAAIGLAWCGVAREFGDA